MERFHAGVLTEGTCRNAERWCGASMRLVKVSFVAGGVSLLFSRVPREVWERFGRSVVAAEWGRLTAYGVGVLAFTDAMADASVGAGVAKGGLVDYVAAYPQIKSSLAAWGASSTVRGGRGLIGLSRSWQCLKTTGLSTRWWREATPRTRFLRRAACWRSADP